MTFIEAQARAEQLNAALTETSVRLNAFPKGPMGLTPDAVKATPEYQEAKRAYDAAFSALRNFNEVYTKRFASELKAQRQERDRARQAAAK